MGRQSDLVAGFNRDCETRGWPMRADASLAFEGPALTLAMQIWHGQRGARAMPSRKDMTPRLLKPFIPKVALFDVVREKDRVRFRSRVTGTEIARRFGEGSGKFIDEAVPSPFRERWLAILQLALDTGAPVRTTSRLEFQNQSYLKIECLVAPLADDPKNPDTMFLVAHIAGANEQVLSTTAALARRPGG